MFAACGADTPWASPDDYRPSVTSWRATIRTGAGAPCTVGDIRALVRRRHVSVRLARVVADDALRRSLRMHRQARSHPMMGSKGLAGETPLDACFSSTRSHLVSPSLPPRWPRCFPPFLRVPRTCPPLRLSLTQLGGEPNLVTRPQSGVNFPSSYVVMCNTSCCSKVH